MHRFYTSKVKARIRLTRVITVLCMNGRDRQEADGDEHGQALFSVPRPDAPSVANRLPATPTLLPFPFMKTFIIDKCGGSY